MQKSQCSGIMNMRVEYRKEVQSVGLMRYEKNRSLTSVEGIDFILFENIH